MFKERKTTDQYPQCHLSATDIQKSLRQFGRTVSMGICPVKY